MKRCPAVMHLPSPPLPSPHLPSPHLTSPHLTSPHLTSPHLTSPHLTSPYLDLDLDLVVVGFKGDSPPTLGHVWNIRVKLVCALPSASTNHRILVPRSHTLVAANKGHPPHGRAQPRG